MSRGTMMIAVGCLLVRSPAMGQDLGHTTTWSKAEDLAGFECELQFLDCFFKEKKYKWTLQVLYKH